MLLDLKPLVQHRDFRFLYLGQLVSTFGNMMTYVALPYQLYQLTGSSFAVGMVGIAQLIPLLFTAFVGGAYADAMDRRKLVIASELALTVCSVALALNAISAHQQVWIIYLAAALSSGINGFHRPAHNAMTPGLVEPADLPAVSALNSFKETFAAVAGPALGGILITWAGLGGAYWADALSFLVSLIAVYLMRPLRILEKAKPPGLSSIVEGIKYARSREELIGTYAVDIVAMIFGMPMALFPAVAEGFGGAKVVGLLYSAPSVGAFIVTISSGWMSKVQRQGAAVIIAAALWGIAIVAFGMTHHFWLAVFFLGLAGGADAASAIFRNTIWSTTIPDHLRGRLAGIEMVSYMTGPLLGNAESGLVAALANTQVSIVSGGVLCVAGVFLCTLCLPRFWKYDYRRWRQDSAEYPS